MLKITRAASPRDSALLDLSTRSFFPLIYHTPGFIAFLEQALGVTVRWITAENRGALAGLLPWAALTAPGFGTVINSLPWFGSHGGCIVAKDAPPQTRELLVREFSALLADCPDLYAANLSLSPFEEKFAPLYIELLRPRAVEKRIAQIVALRRDDENGAASAAHSEAVWYAALSSNTRKQMRKAERQGFILEEGDTDEGWEYLYRTHSENMLVMGGKAKPLSHLEAFRRNIPKNHRRLALARHEGRLCSALLGTVFGPSFEYIMPVITHEYRSVQPLTHIIAHMMQDELRRGAAFWNFGGTWKSQRTLHRFKAGWGAVDRDYTCMTVFPQDPAARFYPYVEELARAFPFFFVFPYERLSGA